MTHTARAGSQLQAHQHGLGVAQVRSHGGYPSVVASRARAWDSTTRSPVDVRLSRWNVRCTVCR